MRYAAFLRAINVGGRNVVRMAELKERVEALGFRSVSTYLQSGNVLFEAAEDAASLTERIEAALEEMTGSEISVMVRSLDDLQRIIALDPFAGAGTKDSHRYVTFLRDPARGQLPERTPRGDLEILLVTDTEVYSIPHEAGGRFGQPGAFVEKKLGIRSTTRNWAVVRTVAERLVQ